MYTAKTLITLWTPTYSEEVMDYAIRIIIEIPFWLYIYDYCALYDVL